MSATTLLARVSRSPGRNAPRLARGPVLGPYGQRDGDHRGMAGVLVRLDSGGHMAPHHRSDAGPTRSGGHVRRRDAVRLLAVVLSVLALILTSSALNWVTEAQAAAPKKAVVIAGPVHSLTTKYKGYAKAIAAAAEAQGMETVRIFHPYAPQSRVIRQAQGADLLVYVGHGNGWPSAYGPFQENTKNGLGLDRQDEANRGPNNVAYKGANWLRENIQLAPDAVVILSHLSYASGNASSGMAIPTRDVAVQRVDNYANGFLSIGASVVWALGWQPGADVINALFEEDATMDAVFRTRYGDYVNPRNGWIGDDPGYYDSERIPGARIHIDPDPAEGYLRAVTGDLGFTTTEWRESGSLPPDTTAPVVSKVRATQPGSIIVSADDPLPVFTPNGDGVADSLKVSYSLSEGAFLEVKVKRDGGIVRRWTTWALKGNGSISWNGRDKNGKDVDEGKYQIMLVPTDRAGNVGEPGRVKAKVLNSLKAPKASPGMFYANDGDSLAQASALKASLTRNGTVSVVIRNAKGDVVRRGIEEQAMDAGMVRFRWDGKNGEGGYVPWGVYTARFRVARPAGSYAHDVKVRVMPFQLSTPTWKLDRGDTIKFTVISAEPLGRKPVVSVKQRNVDRYEVPKTNIKRLSDTKWKVVLKTRSKGKAGEMKVKIVGTDTGGGINARGFTFKLR